MNSASFVERVRRVAALDHPVTQSVYRLLAEHGEVGRDATADALGVARSVAAFHLDKLVDSGLADVRFARLTGRSGPGAGRTAKVYSRSESEVGVSLPERRYDLAGELLARAVERASDEGVPVDRALRQAAADEGRQIGEDARDPGDAHTSPDSRRDELVAALEQYGYEPRARDDEVVLTNCPFHALAEQHRDRVCGMNLELLTGVVDGAGGADLLDPHLAPEPGYCCVRLRVK